MSLAIALIDAALGADLNKNELKTFLVLFRQTLCYGKTSDALTFKRVAKLSGIRKDRIKPALQRLVSTGLFEATPHKLYEHAYRIAAPLLAQLDGDFVALPVPKTEIPSEIWVKTYPKNGYIQYIPLQTKPRQRLARLKPNLTSPHCKPCVVVILILLVNYLTQALGIIPSAPRLHRY